jgi:hypothetical protein
LKQPNKKPCIQERIKDWSRKNKWLLLTIFVAVGILCISVLEVFGYRILDFFAHIMRDFENMFPEAFRGIVTFLSGALSFAFGRYIYDEYRKPKLEIVRVDPLSSKYFKTWRVIVKNTGKTAAENCTGSIHLSGKDANGNNVNLEGSVCWSTLDNPNIITLNVEDEQSLDVYSITFAEATLQFPTEKGWSSPRASFKLSDFENPAQLRIKIRITAKISKPHEKTYFLRKQENEVIMTT